MHKGITQSETMHVFETFWLAVIKVGSDNFAFVIFLSYRNKKLTAEKDLP